MIWIICYYAYRCCLKFSWCCLSLMIVDWHCLCSYFLVMWHLSTLKNLLALDENNHVSLDGLCHLLALFHLLDLWHLVAFWHLLALGHFLSMCHFLSLCSLIALSFFNQLSIIPLAIYVIICRLLNLNNLLIICDLLSPIVTC